MILTVAWRNIWRNKRRTLITAASIFFALFFALFMRSLIIGTFGKISDDIVSAYTGHIQIHKSGYWDDKTINNVFVRDTAIEKSVGKIKNVTGVVPRLESFALASVGENTKPAIVSGIIPKTENEMTKLKDKVVEGKYLNPKDSGVLIGDGLAEYLGLGLNDTLILIGQGYHAISAAGKYPVRGIVHTNSPELNKSVVYMTLENSQEFYSTPNMLTALSIVLKSGEHIANVQNQLKNDIKNDEFEIMNWEELLFELKQLIVSKQSGSYAMLGLLYMIVGFGVFGTIVMMTSERWREFGLLISLGMKKAKLMTIVFIETILIGALGVISGFAVSLPILYYYSENPILLTGETAVMYSRMGWEPVMVFSVNPSFMISQVYIVIVIVLISVSYPIFKLINIKPALALKH